MADDVSAVKSVPVLETSQRKPAALGKDAERVFAVYRDYVRERVENSDIWGKEFAERKKTTVYTVRRIEPSLLPGFTAYLGTAIDHAGGGNRSSAPAFQPNRVSQWADGDDVPQYF